MTNLILATTSSHRIKIFKELGLDFIIEASDVDEENIDKPKDPEGLVKYLSKLKSEAVAKKYSEGIVIGLDTIVNHLLDIFEKPKSREESLRPEDRYKKPAHKAIYGFWK